MSLLESKIAKSIARKERSSKKTNFLDQSSYEKAKFMEINSQKETLGQLKRLITTTIIQFSQQEPIKSLCQKQVIETNDYNDLLKRRRLFLDLFFNNISKSQIKPITQPFTKEIIKQELARNNSVPLLANELLEMYENSKIEKIRAAWLSQKISLLEFSELCLLFVGSNWSISGIHKHFGQNYPVITSNNYFNLSHKFFLYRYIRVLDEDLGPSKEHQMFLEEGVKIPPHGHLQCHGTSLNCHIGLTELEILITNQGNKFIISI